MPYSMTTDMTSALGVVKAVPDSNVDTIPDIVEPSDYIFNSSYLGLLMTKVFQGDTI